jgi:hypothetical protein
MCAVTIIAVTQPDTINSSVRARARGVREAMHDRRGDTTVPLAVCRCRHGGPAGTVSPRAGWGLGEICRKSHRTTRTFCLLFSSDQLKISAQPDRESRATRRFQTRSVSTLPKNTHTRRDGTLRARNVGFRG